ncbi:MAG TPA: penicillin-binding transpeptidase domain-containing protein, partial [Candidatus Paceibacterota bacterium]
MATKSNYKLRIRIISVSIFLFALLLIGRLYFLQVVNNDVYIEKAERQYSSTAKNIFTRGSIFFRNKDNTLVSAATLKSGSTITINPQILKDPEIVYEKIKDILPKLDRETFIAKATKNNDPYEEISTKEESEIGQKIDDLKIPGLKSVRDRWRFYPGGQMASHVVGMLGYKGDEYAGRYGLERQYETELLREDGAYTNFFAQVFEGIKKATSDSGEEADIVTTIEPVVEAYLENVLASTTEKWSGELTGGIIMDPNTGEIIAMEVYPSFDPNHPELQSSSNIFSNPLVENVYEMGSIIKPLTVAAGIDAGVITPQTTYYDQGFVIISGKKISNFDGKERGVVGI